EITTALLPRWRRRTPRRPWGRLCRRGSVLGHPGRGAGHRPATAAVGICTAGRPHPHRVRRGPGVSCEQEPPATASSTISLRRSLSPLSPFHGDRALFCTRTAVASLMCVVMRLTHDDARGEEVDDREHCPIPDAWRGRRPPGRQGLAGAAALPARAAAGA